MAVSIARRLAALAIQFAIAIGSGSVAAADPGPSGDLDEWSVSEVVTGDEAVALVNEGNDDGHDYSLINMCGDTPGCVGLPCHSPPHGGILFELLQDGESHEAVCLNPDQAAQLGQVTPGLVLREFKKLTWPSAELVVQPPDHRPLVNMETLYYTTLDEPQTQTIRLLGHKVEIEATPSLFVWHSDQGGETWETTDPSERFDPDLHDDPAEFNHWIYDKKGEVRPSVDVVYSGRYRLNGGDWQEIPETLTVVGDAIDVTVLEAVPVLTGED